MDLDLVYLCRGGDQGLAALSDFLDSYDRHPPGVPHRLTILMKGWDGHRDHLAADKRARAAAPVLDLPDDGFDWGAYARAAEHLTGTWFCAVNSHSRIEAEGWLGRLRAALDAPDVALVGCTASLGTAAPVARFFIPHAGDMKRVHGAVGGLVRVAGAVALLPWRMRRADRRFPGFPNPHLRSTGFMLRRETFLTFCARHGVPRRKSDAHAMESGRDGLTRFIEAAGGRVLVCGRSGGPWPVADAAAARTFRSGDQANLLVSDNQTRAYATAPREGRRALEFSAWARYMTE